MNEFDSYRPTAWQIDGLTVQPATRANASKSTVKQNQSWKIAVTAYAFSIGVAMCGIYIAAPSQAVAALVTKHASEAYNPHLTYGNDVPPGYWTHMIAVLRAAPIIPEEDDGSTDPEPLI